MEAEIAKVKSVYVAKTQIATNMGYCRSAINARVAEIKKEVLAKTYPRDSVIEDGDFIFVDYHVWHHYIANRSKLKSKNTRKYADPFIRSEWTDKIELEKERVTA